MDFTMGRSPSGVGERETWLTRGSPESRHCDQGTRGGRCGQFQPGNHRIGNPRTASARFRCRLLFNHSKRSAEPDMACGARGQVLSFVILPAALSQASAAHYRWRRERRPSPADRRPAPASPRPAPAARRRCERRAAARTEVPQPRSRRQRQQPPAAPSHRPGPRRAGSAAVRTPGWASCTPRRLTCRDGVGGRGANDGPVVHLQQRLVEATVANVGLQGRHSL